MFCGNGPQKQAQQPCCCRAGRSARFKRTNEVDSCPSLTSSVAVPYPSWHADVLREREIEYKEGSSGFTDWPEAKKRIRNQLK
ncbi:hypothetical protein Dthio_PD0414 [Desulfonatronospira thiodismutans ASO3-1]|uniref:Uncharacterized protein n=1 Tax=Desulfonatronospira thiodismutans ASO3-1 TaxID=555779 RepID=D6SU08_9BACT|nr:hypothetical protein Dthio_PD0414 [Desulfonatronospira thiodismutans ASO3-1]